MNTIDRWIGICMVIVGIGLFVITHMLEPYMGTLSGTVLPVAAILTTIIISAPTAVFVVLGAAQTAGLITIKVVETK